MTTLTQLSERAPAGVTRPEIELLLCCARTCVDPETAERIRTLVQENLDWRYLVQTSLDHRVMPLLYQNLNATCSESVPQPILVELLNHFQVNAASNLFLTTELLKLLNLFEANDMTAIPFKGPVLAASAYGNLSLRQFGDLDLLVEECNFEKAVELLTCNGYQLTLQLPWEFHLTSNDGSYSIDLHREFAHKNHSFSPISRDIWEHLEPCSLVGTTVSTLTPETCLLILLLNGNRECWRSLNRLCDVAELIHAHPHMDWQQVMEQAEKMSCKRLIFLGLLLARNLLGTSFPELIWQQVQSDSVANSLALQVQEQLFSEICQPLGPVEETFFYIKTRERWQDKAQYFFGLIHHSGLHPTARDRDVIPLPARLSFLYYLIRPFRVFIRYWKILFNCR